MYLKYNIDYDKKSYSIVHTPTLNYLQLPFHIEVMGHVYARSNYYTQRSNLDSYLLVVTLDGEGYLKYRNKKVTIRKNQAFFIDCREYQDYGTAEAGYWEMLWFHIIGTAVPSYFEMINGRSINVVTLSDTSDIKNKFDLMYSYISNNDIHSDLKLCSVINSILTDIAISRFTLSQDELDIEHHHIVLRAKAFIEKEFNRNISVKIWQK